ncbi:MAG: S9 family peptidase [Leptolyngbya sp. PLA2]|nr:S9 family peptidase [Leptolyngbya sp.]MCE7971260.1 S9 family peptidase [Leptolyngbya sp. PL-A2]MCQ3939619.1 S9 family peptidase [cyanobacterium CYA1]MDL1903875.1 S9 family peptidase [Synechococcales cyanobacterium CNB]GIK18589.1 MAG: peptidase S9 [Planctomycetota bacterium]
MRQAPPLLPIVAVLLAAPSLALAQAAPRYTARQFYDTVAVGGPSFTHDGSRIVYHSDASGVFNVYSVPFGGGEPTQLTFSRDHAHFAVSTFPEDDRVLFTADQGGNELNHLFVLLPDGTTHDLTPGENLKAQFLGWSGDETAFYVLTNERDPRHFDLYRYDADDYTRTLYFENTEGWSIGAVSRDCRWVALTKTHTNADSDVYLADVTTGEARLVTPHEPPVSHGVAAFTPDSTTLIFTSNADSEFVHTRTFVLAGVPQGERNHRVLDRADWDVAFTSFSRDGRYRVVAVNADARTVLRAEEWPSRTPLALPEFPRGDVTGITFSRDGKRVALVVNGDTSPANIYSAELGSGQVHQITRSLSPAMKQEHLVESEVVRYPSFDGVEIPSLLYRPHGASAQNKAPALVWVHGGPGGQSRTGYNALVQFLVNQGYAVLAVNNRGSSGYGKTFFHMDDRDHGGGDLKDCVHARTYLASLDWIDPDRIAIIGGSYGGFIVAAALTFHPEAFDAGVNIFGVTNWVRTLESIPPWWAAFRDSLYAEMGDPATDRERLHAISPLFHAGNIVRPLMVIQGANDPRVLKAESDDLVAAARENGATVDYLVFDDEGHGFLKKENRITAAERIAAFLEAHLRGE